MSSRRCAFQLGRRMFGIYSSNRTVHSVSEVPVVYVSRMKSVLESNRIPVQDGHTCLSVSACPVGCPDKPEGKFFINKVTGLFVCHACGQTGPWTWLDKRLKDKSRGESVAPVFPVPESGKSQGEPVPDEIMARCQPASMVSDKDLKECLGQLHLKYVKQDLLADCGALVGPSEILLPLRGPNQEISAWRCIFASQDQSERPEEKVYWTHSLGQLLLANSEAWQSTNVVLVPSGADFLALAAQKIPTICVGSQLLPQEVLPRLEDFKEVTLWFGQHQVQAKRVARKLGLARCKIVRNTELASIGPLEKPQSNGPHDELLIKGEGAKLERVIRKAEKLTHPAIISFGSLRAEIYDAITRQDKNSGVPWTRFPILTTIMGGFRDGELTILTGPTGSGKTTFLAEYSLDLCQQGVNTLWGSFEIRNTRLAKTMLTQMAGVNLETNLDRFDEFADKMEQLPLHYLDFHGQQPLKTVMAAVNHAQYILDLGHVIIDNVQFMLGLGESESRFIDRFYRQDQVIEAFRAFATATNCHVTLVIHPRKEREAEELTTSSIFGSAKATQEADNVYILQNSYVNGKNDFKQRKFLQVAKNRYSGDLGLVPLDFNKENLSFVKKKRPVVKHIGQEPLQPIVPKSDENILSKARVDDFELFLNTHANMLK